MKRFCLLLMLLLSLGTGAQKKKDTTLVYLDEHLQLTAANNASFYGVSVKVDGGWLLYALYPDTTPVIRAYYKDKQLMVKHGPYTLYYPKHKKAREGYYTNNNMTGVWRFWHENGQLRDSGLLSGNYLTGVWKSWHPNGAPMNESTFKETLTESEKNALAVLHISQEQPPYSGIRHGKHQSWYSNGNRESIGSFDNNQLSGTWQWYHQNGLQATEEVYKDGLVVSLQCFDSTGKPAGDLCSLDKPALLKHYGDYKDFIFQNLTWPKEARRKRIEGDVHVRFTVNRLGKLQTLNITASEPVLKKAVEELFDQMKEWEAAISHNRTVDFSDEMIIPFRL